MLLDLSVNFSDGAAKAGRGSWCSYVGLLWPGMVQHFEARRDAPVAVRRLKCPLGAAQRMTCRPELCVGQSCAQRLYLVTVGLDGPYHRAAPAASRGVRCGRWSPRDGCRLAVAGDGCRGYTAIRHALRHLEDAGRPRVAVREPTGRPGAQRPAIDGPLVLVRVLIEGGDKNHEIPAAAA